MEIGMGVLGWQPRVFWRSTFPELLAAYRGYQLREDRQDLRAGMVVAAIYEQNRNPEQRKEPITVYDFFPHLQPKQPVIDEEPDEPQDEDDGTDDFLRALKGDGNTDPEDTPS